MTKFSRQFNNFKAILLIIVLAMTIVIVGCTSFEKLTKITEEFPRAQECGNCHVDIYREWSDSPHARAFTNPHYRDATNEYQFTDCLGCHTPEPEITASPPLPRTIFRDEGVTCVSCHLEEGKLSGPIEPTGKVAPHPIDVDGEQYRNSRFCGRCHEGTFTEWDSVTMEDKPTCQQCHMPTIKRKITQAKGFLSKMIVAMEEEVHQKQHVFAIVPDNLPTDPFTIHLTGNENSISLTLHNHLAHSLPTGDFGVRIVVLEVLAINKQNEATPIGKYELVKELGTALAPQSSREWLLQIPPETKSIRIRLFRHGLDKTNVMELLNTEMPLL